MIRTLFRSQFPIHALAVLLFIIILTLGYFVGKVSTLNTLHSALIEKGQIIKLELESELHHFANTARIYSQNQILVNFLHQARSQKNDLATNLRLLEIEQAAQASDVYLLKTNGEVVASSNWNRQNSFINNNFAFRQYVKQALVTGEGFELAVGRVSRERGAYFASAVHYQGKTIGVLVVKANITKMESSDHLFPLERNFSFIIQNQQQKIFLSDHQQWRLKTLKVNTSVSDENTLNARTNSLWRTLGFSLWRINLDNDSQQWLVYQDEFQHYPWHLKILGVDSESTNDGILVSLTLGISYIALVSFYLFFRERRRNIERLQRSHEHLSEQVALRTQDLTATNARLTTEIAQRSAAERELIAAQEQLVQAAKLATIGQLSSSINHELNQPIAALYSFLQTTEKMLEKGMLEQVRGNIKRMYQLTERLTSIVSQFKNFSRKTNQQLTDVSLRKTINNAMAIVNHHVQQHAVAMKLKPLGQDVIIYAEPYQLEQVIVNLLTNAVDAMPDTFEATISISFSQQPPDSEKAAEAMAEPVEHYVVIMIKDNGPGIEPHYLNQIFEPFFTTKYHSGLGLGLSISRRIIESFNGELSLENNPEGGAVARISLPIKSLSVKP